MMRLRFSLFWSVIRAHRWESTSWRPLSRSYSILCTSTSVCTEIRQFNRSFHSSKPGSEPPTAETWPEHEFVKVADNTLTALFDQLEPQGYDRLDGFDIEFSMGVLTISLGPALGTFVINTQTPNRQLWLSSPRSGPARYYWDSGERQWRATRDNHCLRDRLNGELQDMCGLSVSLKEEDS
eukprot:Plantae.Rhodophyta-Purpureofilum_apyrenoidigerum.ctg10592.p1 GENE.Plantae.Rhodophyta-Purpureofilum_apyrenoidigerum.ctg10592~~Plantae.Rhodophyta-Purpureofilum_apyrenoidigerum.ctg10592.p1  ORF type:complete len:181 (-),score=12.09 Plantae.Rhodophyta-Purpureofilum_apyrenoidigerum.ctg10592:107-649(-)